jgi:hypothetical protein
MLPVRAERGRSELAADSAEVDTGCGIGGPAPSYFEVGVAVDRTSPTPLGVIVKTIVTHTVTYSVFGWLALVIMDYTSFFATTSLSVMMRQTSDPWVMAGPLFQPIRGILFGIVFYLLRGTFFGRKRGWLVLWVVLMALGVLGTFGPAPGSIEGMLYTVFPWQVHVRGLPEALLQTLFLSWILVYWVDHPEKKWVDWVMGIAFAMMMAFPILGLVVGQRG